MREFKRLFKWNNGPEIWACAEDRRTRTFENQSPEEIVNDLAKEGWEVVSCSDNSVWLRRTIE